MKICKLNIPRDQIDLVKVYLHHLRLVLVLSFAEPFFFFFFSRLLNSWSSFSPDQSPTGVSLFLTHLPNTPLFQNTSMV